MDTIDKIELFVHGCDVVNLWCCFKTISLNVGAYWNGIAHPVFSTFVGDDGIQPDDHVFSCELTVLWISLYLRLEF